jgi:hypothetical protein
MTDLSKYTNKEDLFKFMKENKALLTAEKKFSDKQADSFSHIEGYVNEKGDVVKAQPSTAADLLKKDSLRVKVVINTTNLMDSHTDVHMKGIWKKTLKEQKTVYLLQEHQMRFDSVITTNVKASTKEYDWSELGYGFKGNTEALVFDAEITKERNAFMFEQYAKGYVMEHSVGMRYVNLEMCINSDEQYYAEEKSAWDKYYPEIANKEEADQRGYFWAVTEAKLVEGSAVVKGSNYATPTISVKENIEEPVETTPKENKTEPQDCTLEQFKEILTKTLLKK